MCLSLCSCEANVYGIKVPGVDDGRGCMAALTCGVYIHARTDERSTEESLMCAAPILVAAIALLVVLRVFSKTVEGMDVYARRYAQLRETELGHREGDELGPAPFAHDGPLRQPGELTTVEDLLAPSLKLRVDFSVKHCRAFCKRKQYLLSKPASEC